MDVKVKEWLSMDEKIPEGLKKFLASNGCHFLIYPYNFKELEEIMPTGRSDHKERKEQKIKSLCDKAAKARNEASSQHKKAETIGSLIPFGQPILVGHHSEKRHRADIRKIETAQRKSVEAGNKADYYENKAKTAADNSSISGDDPAAVVKYKDKMEQLKAIQKKMKSINAYWRKHKSMLGYPGMTDTEAAKIDEKMKTAYPWVQKSGPYESWQLRNFNAEINRIKRILKTFEQLDSMEADTIKFISGEMRVNVDINRVQFVFDDKPSKEIRYILKNNGFRWSPSEMAWQRLRTLTAVDTAKALIPQLVANKDT